MRGWLSLHLTPLKSITKHTFYLVHIFSHLIINWVDLWEYMSSYFIHNITWFLLGIYRIFPASLLCGPANYHTVKNQVVVSQLYILENRQWVHGVVVVLMVGWGVKLCVVIH